MFDHQAVIFCDGACSGNPGPGGWGAIVVVCDHVVELGGFKSHTTNNQMEIWAAIQALDYLINQVQKLPKKIVIYTDSSYLIKVITKWIYGWIQNNWVTSQGEPVKNVDLLRELLKVVNQLKPSEIEWVYVPGHSGVVGNERVDEIAVAFSKQITPSLHLFNGKLADYPRSHLLDSLPNHKKDATVDHNNKARAGKKPMGYLAYVNEVVYVFKTWSECAQATQGKSGAKYRKFSSPDEAISILRSWNVPDDKIHEVQHEIQ
jgi:ribonuclease HI